MVATRYIPLFSDVIRACSVCLQLCSRLIAYVLTFSRIPKPRLRGSSKSDFEDVLDKCESIIESASSSPSDKNDRVKVISSETPIPELERLNMDDLESDYEVDESLALDGPAVNLRKKRSNQVQSLTEPNNATTEDGPPAPIERRLFESLRILSVDIGATRTKIMYQFGSESRILPPIESKDIWGFEEGLTPFQRSKLFRARMGEYLEGKLPLSCLSQLDAVVFAVPGTVDLTPATDDMCVVRNMPSLSPGFKGFNFKHGFSPLFPRAKIYAVADNMGAAMGVASSPQFRQAKSGLVIVLGTAPAVATFFRGEKKHGKTVELAIWQSWVWFTKIPLVDPYGYCGGLQTDGSGFKLRDRTDCKIPHEKSRIRFAIDASTWKRLRGRLDWLPSPLQGNLSKEDARVVWAKRVQAAVNALCLRFHHTYGKPEIVVLLGGNALKCTGRISQGVYMDPDFSRSEPLTVPVFVPSSDEEQQLIHMRGLAQAASYRISQVYAHGPDPLARGWTRGGEIHLWVRRREIL